MNSLLSRPTWPCARHAPNDCFFGFPPWVIGVVIAILLIAFSPAQSVVLGAHTLLFSKSFCGNSMPASGYNTALLHVDSNNFDPINPSTATTVSGMVWWDQNDSGTVDNSELAIPNSIMQLFSQSDPSKLVASVRTNSAGQYLFTVNPGSYYLRNATPSSKGEYLTSDAQIDPNNKSQYDLIVTGSDNLRNLNFGELDFPSQLISKRLFLSSSDPLQPAQIAEAVPEPGVWTELLCAAMAGLMCFRYKYKQSSAR